MTKLSGWADIHAVLFDLDGTLADTREDIAQSVNYLRTRHGLPPLSVETVSGFIGSGVRTLIQRVLEGHTGLSIDQLINEFRAHYIDHCLDKTVLYPGIADVLRALKKRAIKMAVITNKPVEHSKKVLDGLGIAEYFQVILGGDSAPRKKPHPDMIHMALEALRVAAHNAVVVGDSEIDVQAARHAGARVVGVRYGIGRLELLHAAEPDILLDSPLDLLPLLGLPA